MKQQYDYAPPVSRRVNVVPIFLLLIPFALALFGLVNAVIHYLMPGSVSPWMMVAWITTSIVVAAFLFLHFIYYTVLLFRKLETPFEDGAIFAMPFVIALFVYVAVCVGLVVNKLFSAFSITLFVLLCVVALIDLLIAFPQQPE